MTHKVSCLEPDMVFRMVWEGQDKVGAFTSFVLHAMPLLMQLTFQLAALVVTSQ